MTFVVLEVDDRVSRFGFSSNIEHQLPSFKLSWVVDFQELQLGCESFSSILVEEVNVFILKGKVHFASRLVDPRHVGARH